jgi:hypothetical protein
MEGRSLRLALEQFDRVIETVRADADAAVSHPLKAGSGSGSGAGSGSGSETGAGAAALAAAPAGAQGTELDTDPDIDPDTDPDPDADADVLSRPPSLTQADLRARLEEVDRLIGAARAEAETALHGLETAGAAGATALETGLLPRFLLPRPAVPLSAPSQRQPQDQRPDRAAVAPDADDDDDGDVSTLDHSLPRLRLSAAAGATVDDDGWNFPSPRADDIFPIPRPPQDDIDANDNDNDNNNDNNKQ